MGQRRQKGIIVLFIFLLCLCLFFFLKPVEEKNNLKVLLRQMSQQERAELTTLCEYLIKETDFGYTLFGTKPVSWLVRDERSEGSFLNKNRLLFERVFPVLEKLFAQRKIKKYLCLFSSKNHQGDVLFINKELFAKTICKNRYLFERIAAFKDDPDRIFACLFRNGDFFECVCKGDDALLGICFGYGMQNALNFARRQQIGHYFYWQGILPWKFDKTILSEEQKDFLGLESFSLNKGRHLRACKPIKKLLPYAGFSCLKEEIEHLMLVLQPNKQWVPNEIASVQFPQFLCDPTSQETKNLLVNYKKEQQQLASILSSNTILEQVFEKLIEE